MIASANINTGPIIQFKNKEIDKIFTFLKTLGNIEKSTFAKGGYIIKINPMAMGIFVDPTLNLSTKSGVFGKKYPMEIPINIARKIHKVRFRFKKPIFFGVLADLIVILFFYLVLFLTTTTSQCTSRRVL